MPEFARAVLGEIAWPFALVLAWLAGELGHRWLSLPRISSYGVVGFLLAAGQTGVLPDVRGGAMVLLVSAGLGALFGVAVPGLLRRLEPHAEALGSRAALADLRRVAGAEGNDAGFLRRQHAEAGGAEGMVDAAVRRFRSDERMTS